MFVNFFKNKFLHFSLKLSFDIFIKSNSIWSLMLRINWSCFGLEDCRIKLHPENLLLGKSSYSLVILKKWNEHLELNQSQVT